MTSYLILNTAVLGDLLLTANATKLTGIYFADREHAPEIQKDWQLDPRHEVLRLAGDQLRDFLNGRRNSFTVDLDAVGTDFQREVWRQIALIPFGETITYSELAKRAGAPNAVRAAGTATGRNPHSIIVPCHRVIGKSGTKGGYAGGLDRKRQLLRLEMGLPEGEVPDISSRPEQLGLVFESAGRSAE